MSDMLRIGGAHATKKTAQDPPRTTIATSDDLQVYLISGSRMVNEAVSAFSASTMIERFRDIEESVDAAAPVDAQNAPTRGLQNRQERGFAQAPTLGMFSGKKKEERTNRIRFVCSEISSKAASVLIQIVSMEGFTPRPCDPCCDPFK
jgi:hypothetical protein